MQTLRGFTSISAGYFRLNDGSQKLPSIPSKRVIFSSEFTVTVPHQVDLTGGKPVGPPVADSCFKQTDEY